MSERLEDVIKAHVIHILKDSNNNISKAARRLGVERSTLQRKLKRWPDCHYLAGQWVCIPGDPNRPR